MKTKRYLVWVVLACSLCLGPTLAADKWLHVRIDGDDGENVNVNVPLALVETMLPLIDSDELKGGRVRVGAVDELDGIDLRELARALRESPDADFVTVRGEDENVRVAKEGEFLVVAAEDGFGGPREKVRVRVPIAVFEALVNGDSRELDVMAALRVLSEYEGDALVDIDSDDGSVRVWIDSSDTGR